MAVQMDYKKLSLKAGIEIHRRLATKEKLFCSCKSYITSKPHTKQIKRKLRPVVGETGKFDIATKFEMEKDRIFIYNIYPKHVCLVDTDSEPPHSLNKEALETALKICLLLNCEIPNEIHIMRKIITDGSAISGFQRTMLCGINGWFEFNGKKVEIASVNLEEESAGIIQKKDGEVLYRLDRQGIPLVEISTKVLEDFTLDEIKKIARKIGMILKSTGKVQGGIGSIRQDVNISIKNGQRVEIKGVQDLKLVSKVIELEIKRQLELIKRGRKVTEDVRRALPNGTTSYMRPLPGAARMYPESDLEPVRIDESFVNAIEKQLPETIDEKKQRFEKMNLSKELVDEISKSGYSDLFEKIVDKFDIEPRIVANVFVNTLKDLERREKIDVKKLNENDFMELFSLLSKKKIAKESIPEILKYKTKYEMKIADIFKKLGLETLSKKQLEKIVDDIIKKNKGKDKKLIIGIVMSKVRGKASAKDVIELIGKKI